MISPPALSFPEVQAEASISMSPVLYQTDILVLHLRFTDGFLRPWEEVRALKQQKVEVRGHCGSVGGQGVQLEWEDHRVDNLCYLERRRWQIPPACLLISHLEDSLCSVPGSILFLWSFFDQMGHLLLEDSFL